jgi:aspartate racemase
MNAPAHPNGPAPGEIPPSIGIVGGVGPWVDALLIRKLLEKQSAMGRNRDQDAFPVLIGQFGCIIGDRTRYLESLAAGDPLPNPAVAAAAIGRMLVASGARVIGVPCSTFHAKPIFTRFLAGMASCQHVRVVHLIETTMAHLMRSNPECHRIGLLSTLGAGAQGVYSEPLRESGLQPIELSHDEQERVHDAIYNPAWGIKSGRAAQDRYAQARLTLRRAVSRLADLGAEAVILGCTELPLALDAADLPLHDPLDCLASGLVEAYLSEFPAITGA